MDAIKRGARDFVVKPFAPGRVLAAVNRLLVA
jgi:DNA-binding response OmpR family regulator